VRVFGVHPCWRVSPTVGHVRVVFLHALPLDSRMWANQLASVAPLPTLTPNLYPLGRSLDEWADGVIDQIGEDEVILVGCSIGGSCALHIAERRPEQTAGVVLVGAKAGHRPQPELCSEAVALLQIEGLEAAWSTLWAPLFSAGCNPAIVSTAHSIMMDQTRPDVIRGVQAFHARRDLSRFLRSWDKPVVIIGGKHDRSPAPETMMSEATNARRGAFHLINDSGHYVSLEQPEPFNRLLRVAVDAIVET
jgi:pimeloyl-ACP methyl ester carboxylesterase